MHHVRDEQVHLAARQGLSLTGTPGDVATSAEGSTSPDCSPTLRPGRARRHPPVASQATSLTRVAMPAGGGSLDNVGGGGDPEWI
ncbi:hypothetical protein SPHINGOT1_120021 [Sphingomonas sp. T1]|nr:hypothetical protein SPHINGOT1_120021 [Sphingomonas sp. T1]